MLKRLLVGIVAVAAMFAVTATYGRVAAQGGGQAGRGAAAAPTAGLSRGSCNPGTVKLRIGRLCAPTYADQNNSIKSDF